MIFSFVNMNIIQFEFFISNKQGYKVFYTMTPNQPEASWDSQMVDNSELTTISELTPLAIYTVRVQAFTSMGAGPMSNPVKVKTQQGIENSPHILYYFLLPITKLKSIFIPIVNVILVTSFQLPNTQFE